MFALHMGSGVRCENKATTATTKKSEAVFRFLPNPSGDNGSEVPSDLFSKQADA